MVSHSRQRVTQTAVQTEDIAVLDVWAVLKGLEAIAGVLMHSPKEDGSNLDVS